MELGLLIITLLFCGANAAATCQRNAQLVVSTQSVEQKGITFDKLLVNRSSPVEVVYNVPGEKLMMESLSWMHNNEPIKVEDSSNKEVYYAKTENKNGITITLHIRQPSARVTGNWTMNLRTTDSEDHVSVCFIESAPIIHEKLGALRANEGEALSVSCSLESYPPPTEFVWKRLDESEAGNKLVAVENATYKSHKGIKNAILEWPDASKHSGFYMCTAKSPRGTDNLLFEVRIKGKLAYLWPCIGIALELLVLIVTIVIYERAQSKRRKADQSDSLEKPEK